MSLLSLTLQPFPGPILVGKTGHSFSKNVESVNDRFEGYPLRACSTALLWVSGWPTLRRRNLKQTRLTAQAAAILQRRLELLRMALLQP